MRKKKFARRRRAGIQYIPSINPKVPSLAPAKAIAKSYYQPINITLGATATGTIQWYYFSGNSLFDPDYTGSGVTATGMVLNGFNLFYDKYFVRKSQLTLKVYDLDIITFGNSDKM